MLSCRVVAVWALSKDVFKLAVKAPSAQALSILRAPQKSLHLGCNGGEKDECDSSDSHPYPPSGFNFSPIAKSGAFRRRQDLPGVSVQTQSNIGGIRKMGLKGSGGMGWMHDEK